MIRRILLVVSCSLLLAAPIVYAAFPMDKLTFALIVTAIGLAAWGLVRKEVRD